MKYAKPSYARPNLDCLADMPAVDEHSRRARAERRRALVLVPDRYVSYRVPPDALRSIVLEASRKILATGGMVSPTRLSESGVPCEHGRIKATLESLIADGELPASCRMIRKQIVAAKPRGEETVPEGYESALDVCRAERIVAKVRTYGQALRPENSRALYWRAARAIWGRRCREIYGARKERV